VRPTPERIIVWTLLDTGLRVSELAGLTREHIDWQNYRLMIYGKGGIYGTKSKRCIVPLTNREVSCLVLFSMVRPGCLAFARRIALKHYFDEFRRHIEIGLL
jgi:integrase